MPFKSLKVAILNSNPLVLSGLHAVTSLSGYSVCVSSADCSEIDRALSAQQIDLLITEIVVADKRSLLFLKCWRDKYPSMELVLFCGLRCAKSLKLSLQLGIRYHFCFGDPLEMFIGALRKMLRAHLSSAQTSPDYHSGNADVVDSSTSCVREQEIFELLGDGFSRKEIAEKLKLSPRTIDAYLMRLKTNSGISSMRDLVRLAIQMKEKKIISEIDFIPDQWPVAKKL
ncbi:MAG: hypothetical protein A2W80_15950 [Candidatus Riflebacteria bacterium GWC2_50_8]|nr:MAG: hypothetical protein A2W80_15950 [Candidatus Riflebacteria bacterium GWC2_50_8]